MKEYIILLIPSILTATGFVIRFFWERHIKFTYTLDEGYKNKLSFKLEKFYYPLHFNLNRLSNMWEIIQNRRQFSNDMNNNDIDIECMNLHEENQNIIKTNIVQAKPIPRLMEAIMKYDKHVTIYKILKSKTLGKHFCPRTFNAEYPEEFKDIIKSRIDILENELL